MKLFTWRNLRILILLGILFAVAVHTKGQRLASTAWITPLNVVILPINADGSEATDRYIKRLTAATFTPIDRFTRREAAKRHLRLDVPTRTTLGPQLYDQPPSQPTLHGGVIENILWSLRLRYWAWRHTPEGLPGDNLVRMYVLYEQGSAGRALVHSVGLQKGLVGIVHAFAEKRQTPQNNIVIAHELLHTVGATDKYDEQGEPQFPEGYGHPRQNPLYPQRRAEIMAVRRALSETHSEMAISLRSCVIGDWTATEIGWSNDE